LIKTVTYPNYVRAILISVFFVALVLNVASAMAQDAPPPSGWKKSVIGKVAGTQVGFQNWQGGGVNSLALSTGVDGSATRTSGRLEQKHELKLSFGVVKQDTLELRKAEDQIWLSSTFVYKGDGFLGKFNPTLSASVRTQFAEGFNFDTDPIDGVRQTPVKVSAFFAPATLQQSLGLRFEPAPWFTQRFGFGAKETVVTIERFRALYGVDPANSVRVEGGFEALTEIDRELVENVHYKSSLSMFAAFKTADNPDFIWENLIAMKVNSWLNVNFEWVAVFDNDVTDKVQWKEVFSVGVAISLI